MANTIVVKGNHISVTFDGSTPYDSSTSFPAGFLMSSITFKAATAGTSAIVHDGSATGLVVFKRTDVAGAGVQQVYDHAFMKPYVVGTDVAASDIITFEFA